MKAIGVHEASHWALVERSTIAQSYQFGETAGVESGFGALSELTDGGTGARWLAPQEFYDRLRQRVVPLEFGSGEKPIRAFVDFRKGPETNAGIAQHGYVRQAQS